MRLSLKLAVAVAVAVATAFGGSAWATVSHGGDANTPYTCGTGTVSAGHSSVLWPPNHKYRPITVTYSNGAEADTLTTSVTSSDGNGVQDPTPQLGTVESGQTSTSTTEYLRAERPGNKATPGRT